MCARASRTSSASARNTRRHARAASRRRARRRDGTPQRETRVGPLRRAVRASMRAATATATARDLASSRRVYYPKVAYSMCSVYIVPTCWYSIPPVGTTTIGDRCRHAANGSTRGSAARRGARGETSRSIVDRRRSSSLVDRRRDTRHRVIDPVERRRRARRRWRQSRSRVVDSRRSARR